METVNSAENFALTSKACSFATEVHKNQKYGSKPYTHHLNMVVAQVIRYKHLCPTSLVIMVIAAWLHDTVEDGTPNGKDMYKILVREFGLEVADIVYQVTNELGRNRKEQNTKTYPKLAASITGKFLKLCDRLANVRSSIEESSGMFDTYRKEYEEFERVVRTYGEYDEMWDELETLLKINA